ncbi:MAG: shikimate kinase [Candidatus Omnitrophica bacterium]|nr:shikimate kinase [Candidatus Omnitrophota bacterium]
MGAGKTETGQRLADTLGWRYLDSDKIIERRERSSIQKIFKDKGESYFRSVESRVVKDLLLKPQTVLSLGGGVVCRKANRTLIKKRAFVIWLSASAGVIHRRTQGETARPLLNVADPQARIRELLKERKPLYAKCAHAVVPSGGSATIGRIKRLPQIRKIIRSHEAEAAT